MSASVPRPRDYQHDREPCRGGCGALVPLDQMCRPCAEEAVEQWKAERAQRNAPHLRRPPAPADESFEEGEI